MSDWKKNPLFRIAGNWINAQIKDQDYLAAQRVDQFVANSKEVQGRIKKFYGRDSLIIYPPVEVESCKLEVESDKSLLSNNHSLSNEVGKLQLDHQLSFRSSDFGGQSNQQVASVTTTQQHNHTTTPSQKMGYYLFVSRLAFSKHPELAVEICTKLGLPLKVVGQGKMRSRLESIAGPTIEFTGEVSDAELSRLYHGAKALLYPVEDEDFGIVPVEAMGHGLPVIAHRSGGPKETIVDGKTGVFFDTLNAVELQKAIEKADKTNWDAKAIHEHALKFSKKRFQIQIKQLVEKMVKEFDSQNFP